MKTYKAIPLSAKEISMINWISQRDDTWYNFPCANSKCEKRAGSREEFITKWFELVRIVTEDGREREAFINLVVCSQECFTMVCFEELYSSDDYVVGHVRKRAKK